MTKIIENGVTIDASAPYIAMQAADAARGTSKDALKAYAGRVQEERLGAVWTFNVAAAGAAAHEVTTRLDASGQQAMLIIALWVARNAASPAAIIPYSNVDFSPTTLTLAEADSLVTQSGDAKQASFAALNAVVAAIDAGTINSKADVDGFAWPGA